MTNNPLQIYCQSLLFAPLQTKQHIGEMAEWSKAPVLKTGKGL